MKNLFFKFIITLVSGLLLQNVVLAGEIKFVQVTDPHFSITNPYSEEVLRKTVEDINKLEGVSFVAFTGDNIDKPQPEELAAFVRIVNKLNVPYYLVIGES